MALGHGPTVVTNGLVLALDAADRNSYPGASGYYYRAWSGGWSGSYGTATNSFDGNLSTFSGFVGGTFSATYTFSGGLNVSGNVRVYVTFGATSGQVAGRTGVILVDGIDISSKMAASNVYVGTPGWIDVTSEVGSTFNTIVLNGTSGSTNPGISAIEVNGQILIDNTTLIDLSGNGNTGTLTNSPTYSSANGGSIVFDGSNDYVTLPTNLLIHSTGNPFTFSVWFKTTSTGIILGQQNNPTPNSANGYIPAIYVDINGLLRTTCFYSGFVQTSVSSSAVNNGSWNNITVTFLSGTQTSYLNGISYATLSQTQQGYTATYYYFLGSGTGSAWTNFPASPYFNGSISNFSYYNRALTASEIQQNFNALRGRFGI